VANVSVNIRQIRESAGIAVIMAVLSCLATCAPPYDDQADKAITELQHQVDQKIVDLVSIDRRITTYRDSKTLAAQKILAKAEEDASYNVNVPFYDTVDTDLTSAQMRVDASANRATQKIDQTFDALRDVLITMPKPGADPVSMQAVHAAQNSLSEAYLRGIRVQANALFTTLMQYEVTLKSGSTPSK
jgi:hypothetical protein